MDVLTTRLLRYTDKSGDTKELTLTIFRPYKDEDGYWEGAFIWSPPIKMMNVKMYGVDFIQVFIHSVHIARAYLNTWRSIGPAHWQGMADCGLLDTAERPDGWAPPELPPPDPTAGSTAVLTSRKLGYADAQGIQQESLLSFFVPVETEDKKWKCGFTFTPPFNIPPHSGTGADFIEAFLDALAMARVLFNGSVSKACPSEVLLDCEDFPYKIGRSFAKEPLPKMDPEAYFPPAT